MLLMASTRIPVLDFHGNGSVVCLEGIKPQAPSHKLQAKRDSTGALPVNAESTVASSKQQATSVKRATNCRATIRSLTQAPSAKPQATSAKRQALPESLATNQQSL